MNLIITAAGRGMRFRAHGFQRPKPLIRVHGKELLLWVLESFPEGLFDQWVIVTQSQDQVRSALERPLAERYPSQRIRWLELTSVLNGQLLTACATVRQEELHGPLYIHNCDTGFSWNDGILCGDAYGSIPVFAAEGSSWSFVSVDPLQPTRAVEVREKERISDLATIGLYGFASSSEFLQDAAQETAHPERMVKGEYFVAPLYNQAIRRGLLVRAPVVGGVRLYGTPEQVCDTFRISMEEITAMNKL